MTEAEELELLELEKEKALSQKSDEKPLMRGFLPDSMGSLFPSDRERMQMRLDRGLTPEVPEPVSEYSPAEEVALGSIVAPQGAPQALAAAAGPAKAVGSGLLSAGKAAMRSRYGRYGLGGVMFEGGRRMLRGLLD